MDAHTLYVGATGLTAIMDNAAITYSVTSKDSRQKQSIFLLRVRLPGALTVIANAPNPAGLAIVRKGFSDEAVSPLWLPSRRSRHVYGVLGISISLTRAGRRIVAFRILAQRPVDLVVPAERAIRRGLGRPPTFSYEAHAELRVRIETLVSKADRQANAVRANSVDAISFAITSSFTIARRNAHRFHDGSTTVPSGSGIVRSVPFCGKNINDCRGGTCAKRH